MRQKRKKEQRNEQNIKKLLLLIWKKNQKNNRKAVRKEINEEDLSQGEEEDVNLYADKLTKEILTIAVKHMPNKICHPT